MAGMNIFREICCPGFNDTQGFYDYIFCSAPISPDGEKNLGKPTEKTELTSLIAQLACTGSMLCLCIEWKCLRTSWTSWLAGQN
jgi:hypothetical protein